MKLKKFLAFFVVFSQGFKRVSLSGAILLSLVISLGIASPAQATPSPSATVGILSPTGSPQLFTFPVSLSGFSTNKNYLVTLSATSGTLNLPTRTGITASQGFAALTSNSSEFSFFGSYADIQNALASVGFTRTSSSNAVTINIQVTEYAGSTFFYNPDNQHYYEYVNLSQSGAPAATQTGEYSWTAAKAFAEQRTLFGLTGYLTTITSEAENNFIKSKTSAQNVWIGAGRKSTTWNDPNGMIWEWKTGPEAGTPFSQQSLPMCSQPTPCTISAISGAFNSWSPGEPNNYQYPPRTSSFLENYAVTNWQGSLGLWNDLPNLRINVGLEVAGFLVEYGGIGTPTVESSSTSKSSTFITYDMNDQSGSPATETEVVEASVATALASNTFSRANFVFSGWSTTPSGTVAYSDGHVVTTSAPITLYAVWSPISVNNQSTPPTSQVSTVALASTGSSPWRTGLLALFFVFAGLSLFSGHIANQRKAGN